MTTAKSLIVAAAMLTGSLGLAVAQDYGGAYGGNLNTANSLAGKSYVGAPGGVRTSPIGHGPSDGADSGLWNTTNSLAGIATHRSSVYDR